MAHILIVNGHQPFPSSPGGLNAAFRSGLKSCSWMLAMR